MKPMSLLFPLAILVTLAACSSSSSDAGGPVIDSLDVPPTTSTMTVEGQTGQGVTLTLTAHDDTSGMNALHAIFTETGQDQPIEIPGAPTTLAAQKIDLVVLNAPSGAHPIEFHLTDAEGRESNVINATITVP